MATDCRRLSCGRATIGGSGTFVIVADVLEEEPPHVRVHLHRAADERQMPRLVLLPHLAGLP
jgi:hypothetical protein